jgi:hypothetical protein
MVCISSYEQALAHWKKTKSWANNDRPLSGRREKNKALRKLTDGSFECRLYETPLVTYHPAGQVTLLTDDRLSSRMFMERVAPLHCSPVSAQGRTFWEIRTRDGAQFRLNRTEIIPNDDKTWRVLYSTGQATEQFRDKSLCAKIRRNLKMYANWYGVTSRLMNLPGGGHVAHLSNTRLTQLTERPLEPESFMEFAGEAGDPCRYSFYDHIFRATGALRTIPVPFDRLPRNAP